MNKIKLLLGRHVFRLPIYLLVVAFHNACGEIFDLLLLPFQEHALALVRSASRLLGWLGDCFRLFISFIWW